MGDSQGQFPPLQSPFAFKMSSHKDVVSNYAQKIWSSIENNLQAIAPEDTGKLSKLVRDINKFYLSLFSEKDGRFFVACATFVRADITDRTVRSCDSYSRFFVGVFDNDAIDGQLKAAPKIPGTPHATVSPSVSQTSQVVVVPRRQGTGKGSPLKPRKVVVSKRQERVRKKRGFDLSEISPAPATPPRAKKTRTSEETTSEASSQTSESPSEGPSEAESSQVQSQVDPEVPPPLLPQEKETTESRASQRDTLPPLRLQVREKCVQAGVKRFQLLISKLQSDGEEVDSRECEQELFSKEIAIWKRIPEQLECGLRLFWNEVVSAVTRPSASVEDQMRWIVQAHNTANGVANSMAHLVGYVVNAIANDADEDTQIVVEKLDDCIKDLEYAAYVDILDDCACDECTSVKNFDDNYNRYAILPSIYYIATKNCDT